MIQPVASIPRPGRLRSIEPPLRPQHWKHEIETFAPLGPDLAVAFWRMLRRARMWAATPRSARKSLSVAGAAEACERLGHACALAPELVDVFGTFALSIRNPECVETHHLVAACRRVFTWAEARSNMPVATLFAEAAAFLDDSPELANHVARLYRELATFDRAVSWYERAFGLAVRAKDRAEVINALLGYGNLMKDRGDFDRARIFYERVAQRALNTGRRRVAAEAHHSLLALAIETGDHPAAVRHVRKALYNYPIRHPLIPNLVYDFAYLLLRRRFYGLALSPMLRLLSVIPHPHVHVLIHGAIARAAGGLRNQDLFDRSRQAILSLAGEHQQYASSALNGLAEGASAFGAWDQADAYAAAALTIARARHDGAEQSVSEQLLDAIALRELPLSETDPDERGRVETVLQRLLSRLRAWETPPNVGLRGATRAGVRPKVEAGS